MAWILDWAQSLGWLLFPSPTSPAEPAWAYWWQYSEVVSTLPPFTPELNHSGLLPVPSVCLLLSSLEPLTKQFPVPEMLFFQSHFPLLSQLHSFFRFLCQHLFLREPFLMPWIRPCISYMARSSLNLPSWPASLHGETMTCTVISIMPVLPRSLQPP